MPVDGDVRTLVARRGWVVAATGGVLGVLGVLYARPVLLVGAAGVWSWLLTAAVRFHRRAEDTLASVSVEVEPANREVALGETQTVDLRATVERCAVADVVVRPGLPLGASSVCDGHVTLASRNPSGETTVEFASDVLGRHAVGPVELELWDGRGLFVAAGTLEREVEFSVVSPEPQPHVGQGGRRLPVDLPPDSSELVRQNLVESHLRTYHATDDARRIDWNVTARLDDTFVRADPSDENEEPGVAVIVDERRSMFAGPAGESKLAYARRVFDELLDLAQIRSVPVGVVTATERGVEWYQEPRTGHEHYEFVRRSATAPPVDHGTRGRPEGYGRGARAGRRPNVPRALRGAGSAFDSALSAFFPRATVTGGVASPLVAAVERAADEATGVQKLVVFTDDADPDELRQVIRTAEQRRLITDAYVTPTAAFGRPNGSPIPTDEAYRAFREFERIRKDLSRSPRTRMFELCPERWIEAVARAEPEPPFRSTAAREARPARTSGGGG